MEIEAGPRHVQILEKNAKMNESPTTADVGGLFMPGEVTVFRSMVMRANYLATDRPEISLASKEAFQAHGKSKLSRAGTHQKDRAVPSWSAPISSENAEAASAPVH